MYKNKKREREREREREGALAILILNFGKTHKYRRIRSRSIGIIPTKLLNNTGINCMFKK